LCPGQIALRKHVRKHRLDELGKLRMGSLYCPKCGRTPAP
jgi:hypothetical protein